jgi:hypothetical protein
MHISGPSTLTIANRHATCEAVCSFASLVLGHCSASAVPVAVNQRWVANYCYTADHGDCPLFIALSCHSLEGTPPLGA